MKNQNTEFRVNDLLSLKLEEGKTNIYISGKLFRQCKYLLIEIPVEKISSLDDLESIDEAAEKLDHSLEPRLEVKEFTYTIPPETEFWGHCSNLQVWYENGYNTKLLHSNLAFPLLRELVREGDRQAKRVFKEEIAERYNNGVDDVRKYLRSKKYIWEMTDEEFLSLVKDERESNIINQLREQYPHFESSERGGPTLKLNLDIKMGKVIKIDLRGLELTQIPEQIRDLTLVEDLNISFNLLEELPEWINEFTALKVLRITDNRLKTLPKSIGELRCLEELYARGNQLETLPNTLGKLSAIKVLELYQNNLNSIPEAIGNLTNLEMLELHENQLTTLPNSIGDLKNLEILDVHDNQLTSLPDSIGSLTKLEMLILARNKLKFLPASIKKLQNLERLSISDNPIHILPEIVYNLPNLKMLFVRHLKESHISKKSFKNF